eukprot:61467_1
MACTMGHSNIARILLEDKQSKFMKLNHVDSAGNTAFLHALKTRNLDIVQMLLEREHVDLTLTDKTGNTALVIAIVNKHIDISRALMNHPSIDVNKVSHDSRTQMSALRAAINTGNIDILRELLQHKSIQVNIKHEDGRTLLMCAAEKKEYDMVRMILANKSVDVNAAETDMHERTSCFLSCVCGDIKMLEMLLADPRTDADKRAMHDWTPLMVAACHGYTEIVRTLLQHSPAVDVNVISTRGESALILAAQRGFVGTVRVLLQEKSLDIFAKCGQNTALSLSKGKEIRSMIGLEAKHHALAYSLNNRKQ